MSQKRRLHRFLFDVFQKLLYGTETSNSVAVSVSDSQAHAYSHLSDENTDDNRFRRLRRLQNAAR